MLPSDMTDKAAVTEQVRILERGRTLIHEIEERIPVIDTTVSARDAKGGVSVHRESGGHLAMSMLAHPEAVGSIRWDLHMVDTWTVDIIFRGEALGTGLLPLLSLFREPDLVADYLPRQAGLPYIESLYFDKQFAANDWLFHCFVTPFGPLPGADDIHALTAYDLLDEPEGGLLFYAESPTEGTEVHRGFNIPPVKGWRRKRNYVLGATTIFRPSKYTRPLSTVEPSERPGACRSPNCPFYASTVLSNGAGTHCCARCAEKPGKHAKLCQRRSMEELRGRSCAPPPPEWELPTHGTVDFDLYINLKLPIPTFLIPLSFARWVMVKLTNLVYPYLLTLNERFHETPFSERVKADAHGFYKRCSDAFSDPSRPHNAHDLGRCHEVDHASTSTPRPEERPKFIFRTLG